MQIKNLSDFEKMEILVSIDENKLDELEKLLLTEKKWAGCYVWRNVPNRHTRDWLAKKNTCPEIVWQIGKQTYSAEYRIDSNSHGYLSYGIYTKNGKKTTLTAIKSCYYKMCKALDRTPADIEKAWL
ncbi:MAG: hypothetical protein J6X49_12845 [Victivallales bacterium]|nr:hypothetical protein [Victivallales bacterium]